MRIISTRAISYPFACYFLFSCLGCGTPTAPLEGTIRFAGKPIERGVIALEPADGMGPFVEAPIAEGKYRLSGQRAPTLGAKIVRIFGFEKTGKMIEGFEAGTPPGQKIEERRQIVPDKYNQQSKLTLEIQAGSNVKDFDLPK